MKRLSILAFTACILLSVTASAAGDWRKGIWNRDVPENLIILNLEATPVISSGFSVSDPWAAGFNFAYEHKMRPSIMHNKVSFGYGAHIGLSRYFGASIDADPTGNNNTQSWDRYKSYTTIPLMLDFNVYYNLRHSSWHFGISGGINLMLGDRDAKLDTIEGMGAVADMEAMYDTLGMADADIVSIQLSDNNVSLKRAVPTFRALVGYTYELNQNWKLRFTAGIEYMMKYTDEYKGVRIGPNYIDYYHHGDSPAMLNPFVSAGLVYSL